MFAMYPAYPESPADLVPLPRCDGPKLEPFDFQGPQNIEFLEYLGAGLHSHVVKVKIRGEVYALKLVSLRTPPHSRLEDPDKRNAPGTGMVCGGLLTAASPLRTVSICCRGILVADPAEERTGG